MVAKQAIQRKHHKTHTEGIGVFLRFFPEKALNEIGNSDIITFNNDYILKNNLSASYQNQMVITAAKPPKSIHT